MTTRTMDEHGLHVYRDDTHLAEVVADFLAPGFEAGHGLFAVGTPGHLAAVEQRLRTGGRNVDAARASGQYVTADANAAVARLLVDGLPTRRTFDALIGRPLETLASRYGNVRAYGEVVSLLWRDGKRAAALRLEELWNDAIRQHPLELVCGYNARVFDPSDARATPVLGAHTHLVSADGD